ncbi:MAG: CDP-diacylglycerol--serine O-phosphatidyltransferase [Bacteroidetes bacterium]|nr:CDP-diacylglycerol--serine O-phosphatidyltransferase [Bacteroidota bacterium]
MIKTKQVYRHIPNLFTSANILCGCIAIVMVFQERPEFASLLIGLAAVFDFLDGMTARLLKAYSELGKQLDSLADMVSFGVAPAVILFSLVETVTETHHGFSEDSVLPVILPYFAFLVAVFSGLRLAKFNIDTRQTDSFIGLATPANSIFIASLPLIIAYQDIMWINEIIQSLWFLLPVTVVLSFLLISEIPMFSLKFKNLKLRDNYIRYIFIAVSVLLLLIIQYLAIPLIIVFYIIFSFVNNWLIKQS